jgi:uncharacterized membrane protein YGL010W
VPVGNAIAGKLAAGVHVSDINILSDPLSVAIIYLIFGAPGLAVGAVIGALAWRAHRIYRGLIGAVVGHCVGVAIVWWWLVR